MSLFSLVQETSYTLLISLAAVAYFIIIAIYRLYFHPLARFPGPKLAALTSWYAGYHDMVHGGQYVWVVEEMHRNYGPIIRVRPDALHINDPEFIDVLYSQSPKHPRERYWTILQTLHADGSILATRDHELHRKRRSALNPFFSKQRVRHLEPIIHQTLKTLLNRMEDWSKRALPVRLNNPFRAATKDIIQEYAFGPGPSYLEMDDCNAAFFDVVTPQRVCHLGTHVFWLAKLMANLPPSIMKVLLPRVGVFADFVINLAKEIDRVKNSGDLPSRTTIFHEILASDIPESEKETQRLVDEAMVIVIAGSETTASTLAAITYHLLSDASLFNRLKSELVTAFLDFNQVPDARTLDNLPFLNALIEEAIRLYPGATHRQDRTAPAEALTYRLPNGKQYIIPAGTCCGMTAPIINRHPDLYERPDEFLPDRYLKNPNLRKYNFSFSKGTRQCIGINLAYQELQTFTAGIFRRYNLYDPSKTEQDGPTLELYKTKREDIAMHADYITPGQPEGSQGLRVIIRA